MPDISIFAAFAAGLISFISPCVLPLVPAYISFMSGVSLQDMTADSNAKNRSKVIISSLVFIIGFSIVFILLGASATYLGKLLLTKMHIIRKIAGIVIIIFGLHLMGIFKLKFLLYEKRFSSQQKEMSLISVLLIGMAFAFGWSPCLGPILSGILAIAATKENIGQGIFLLSMYSLGLGLPFFLTALATDRFIGYFNKIKKHMRKIEIGSGLFLILIGILIFFDFFTVLSSYLNQWFPFLQKIG
ncbi:MAG: cytochrome c biogenesis protein CcdA [bacterium]|nr:cytochrome c biogenesis protein CcdA [bacterium]